MKSLGSPLPALRLQDIVLGAAVARGVFTAVTFAVLTVGFTVAGDLRDPVPNIAMSATVALIVTLTTARWAFLAATIGVPVAYVLARLLRPVRAAWVHGVAFASLGAVARVATTSIAFGLVVTDPYGLSDTNIRFISLESTVSAIPSVLAGWCVASGAARRAATPEGETPTSE